MKSDSNSSNDPYKLLPTRPTTQHQVAHTTIQELRVAIHEGRPTVFRVQHRGFLEKNCESGTEMGSQYPMDLLLAFLNVDREYLVARTRASDQGRLSTIESSPGDREWRGHQFAVYLRSYFECRSA